LCGDTQIVEQSLGSASVFAIEHLSRGHTCNGSG
jgi:hypothetical protein